MTAPVDSALVTAARSGDEQAVDDLVSQYLPLVYNVVRRALSGCADVDDVVQEIMLRVVRDLPSLREPGSFRAWLLAIAFHQISTYRRGRRAVAAEPIEDAEQEGSDVQDLALLRLNLSGQRRQVVEASRWLDPDHRALLSLWWQENAGLLTRAEVAYAAGLTVAHAGVRLQRMRVQLELSRRIVAALAAQPWCPDLDTLVGGWDGRRTPLWRKRIGRHVTECRLCARTVANQIPVERLLFTFAAIPVPLAVTAAVGTKGLLWTSGAHASVIAKLAHAVAAHPLATAAASAVLLAAPAVTYAIWPAANPPAVAGPPAPSALAVGSWSLEAVGTPGEFLSYASGVYAKVSPVDAASGALEREHATFFVVRGLADDRCYTFRAADGRYLRHYYLRLRLSPADDTQLFREDATFCAQPGSAAGSVTLRSHNYPGSVLHVRDGGIYLDGSNGTSEFSRDSSFVRHDPWAAVQR